MVDGSTIFFFAVRWGTHWSGQSGAHTLAGSVCQKLFCFRLDREGWGGEYESKRREMRLLPPTVGGLQSKGRERNRS